MPHHKFSEQTVFVFPELLQLLLLFLIFKLSPGHEELPPINDHFQVREISPVYAVQSRSILANGADETKIEIELNEPCASWQLDLSAKLAGIKVPNAEVDLPGMRMVNEIDTVCRDMFKRSILDPMKGI